LMYDRDCEEVHNLDIVDVVRKILKMRIDERRQILNWIMTGTLPKLNNDVYVTPCGSLLTKSNHEMFERLIDIGYGRLIDNYVYIPGFFKLSDLILPYLPYLEYQEEYSEYDRFNFMILKLDSTVNFLEYGDFKKVYAACIEKLKVYMCSQLEKIISNLRYLPQLNYSFEEPIDTLAITSRDLIAHRVLDPSRTVHLGFTSVKRYLHYGFDKAVLVHLWINSGFHNKLVTTLISRLDIFPCGYVILPRDEIDRLYVLKWPRINILLDKSITILTRNTYLKRYLKML